MKKHTSTNHGSAASRSIVLAFWFGVVGLLSLGVACYGDVKIVEDPAVVPPTGDPEVGVGGLEGPDCIVDEVGCDGALLRVCKAAVLNAQALPHWEPIQNCFSAALCDPAGSCREAKCAANAMRCDGAVPWTCSDDLTERVEQGACVNAGHCSLVESDCAAEDKQAPCCLDAPCTAGALRCNGGQIERCRDDRTGSDPVMGANCATQALCEDSLATCQPGSSCVCKPPECDVGAGRCTGATLERCNADQTGWEFAEDCGSEGLCKIGQERHAQAGATSLLACEPAPCDDGEYRCTGAALELCNADRTGFDLVQNCLGGPAFCDSAAGVCSDVPCDVGDTRCSGAQVERCRADQSGFEAVPGALNTCATPQLCINNGQVPAFCQGISCTPNQTVCTGSQLQRCNAGQTGFVNVGPACPRPDLCSSQRQRCDTCVPNQRECTPDLRSSRTCGPDGNSFGPLTFCPLGCIAANGTCNTCPVGQYSCQGGLLARCNDGFSFTPLNRAADCSGQNRVSCNGGQLQTSPCALGCNAQRLACNDCAGPQRRCVDTESFQSCQANGTFSAPTDCGDGLLCAGAGQCACTAGQASCDGDALLVCNATGTGFVAGSRCSGAGGNVLRTCSDGVLTTNTCTSAALCTGATGASCPRCTEGERSCSAGQPQVCEGGERVPAAACDAGFACEGAGLCRCSATDVHCTGNQLLQCAADRQSFEPAAACADATLRSCTGNTRTDEECGSPALCAASSGKSCVQCLSDDPPSCTDDGTELRCVDGALQEAECGIDLCLPGIGCLLPPE